MMKKFYILFLAAACILSSCNLLSNNIAEKEIADIDAAKNTALKEIDEASTKAISTAQNEISSATKESIASASEDLNSAIKETEKSIAASVETEIKKTVSEDRQKTDQKISAIAKKQVAVLILSLLALGASIVAIVMSRRRTSHEAIIEEVLESRTIQNLICTVEGVKYKPQAQTATRSDDVEKEVRKFLATPDMRHYIAGLLIENKIKDNHPFPPPPSPYTSKEPDKVENKTGGQSRIDTYAPKVELYARDTPDLELRGVSSSYQPGKSIFKLVLNSNESSTANIEICSDKPEVLQRIIQSDQDLIEPVCKIVSKVNKPSDIKWTAGKAEKVDADSWKVCEQVIVEYK